MIAGRKLLLADDSIAIQKVVDLTFTDEGMEVETVGDGQDALDKLSNFQPDVVLADVFMPGVDGYELCKFIKQSERFSGIPVMLLIGSFEPFDQAEAERAGADDVVTKPFQSIRQLVRRVGSLLGSDSPHEQDSANKHSTLGLASEANSSTSQTAEREPPVDIPVFVEAAVMEETPAVSEHFCAPDIELQTADTRELHSNDVQQPVERAKIATDEDDTIEIEAIEENVTVKGPELPSNGDSSFAMSAITKNSSEQFAAVTSVFSGSVLDLGDLDSPAKVVTSDDFVWDLDFESEATTATEPAEIQPDSTRTGEVSEALNVDAEAQAISHRERAAILKDEPALGQPTFEMESEPTAGLENVGSLSPEAIEAISRRVIEQLSDKVVREIAWEVVPELSELLIKQRMDQK